MYPGDRYVRKLTADGDFFFSMKITLGYTLTSVKNCFFYMEKFKSCRNHSSY